MNGATEATLQELLLVANRMNINLEKFASQVNSTSGGGGGLSGLATVAKFATPAGVALGVLQGAANLVGSAFSVLGNILGKVVTGVTKTAENLFNFAIAAAKGTASLSGLYDAFRDLPFFIGDIAHGFSQIVKYSEDLLGTYRQLTRSGASFGGELFEMRLMASQAGLSLDEFAKLVSANGQLFAGMGAGVQAGLQKFTDASGALVGPDSVYAKKLFGLGYTAEDIGNSLSYIMLQEGVGAKKNVLTADQLASKTAEYMTQLDVLAKITGETAAAQEERLKKEQADALFQSFKDSLSPIQKASLDARLQIANAFGPDFVLAVKNGARGIITPMTDSMINLNQTTGGLLMEISRSTYSAARGNQTAEQARAELTKQIGQAANYQGQFVNRMTTQLQALNGDMINQPLQNLYNQLQRGEITLEQLQAQALGEIDAQTKGGAAMLAVAENNIKQFGNMIMGVAGTILGPMTITLAKWGEGLTKWMTETGAFKKVQGVLDKFISAFEDYIQPHLEKLGVWWKNTIGEFENFDKLNWDEIWIILKEQFGKLWTDVLKPMWDNDIRPGLSKMWDGLQPVVVSMFSAIFEAMKDAILGKKASEEDFKQQDRNEEILSEWHGWSNILSDISDKMDSGMAQMIEGAGRMLGMDGMADRAAKSRIDSETDYLKKRYPEAYPQPKASGGPINPGSYLVGEKGPEVLNIGSSGNIVTNDNITELMARAGQSDKTIETLMQMLNSHNVRMLSTLSEMSDYTKRNNDALKDLSGDAFA
jgi:hypothetical protein